MHSSNLAFYGFANMQYIDQQLNHKLETCFYKDITFQTDITECSNATVQCFLNDTYILLVVKAILFIILNLSIMSKSQN